MAFLILRDWRDSSSQSEGRRIGNTSLNGHLFELKHDYYAGGNWLCCNICWANKAMMRCVQELDMMALYYPVCSLFSAMPALLKTLASTSWFPYRHSLAVWWELSSEHIYLLSMALVWWFICFSEAQPFNYPKTNLATSYCSPSHLSSLTEGTTESCKCMCVAFQVTVSRDHHRCCKWNGLFLDTRHLQAVDSMCYIAHHYPYSSPCLERPFILRNRHQRRRSKSRDPHVPSAGRLKQRGWNNRCKIFLDGKVLGHLPAGDMLIKDWVEAQATISLLRSWRWHRWTALLLGIHYVP